MKERDFHQDLRQFPWPQRPLLRTYDAEDFAKSMAYVQDLQRLRRECFPISDRMRACACPACRAVLQQWVDTIQAILHDLDQLILGVDIVRFERGERP
jgi:hypothetical protein